MGSAFLSSGSASLDYLRVSLALNWVRDVIDEGATLINVMDGIADEFGDQSGIDTGASSGFHYDAASNTYSNSNITGATGTPIGDMTASGGLAAAFDGTNSKSSATGCAEAFGINVGYVGKDWGSGNSREIIGVVLHGASDWGFIQSSAGLTCEFELYGSNSAPANSQDGTLLDSWSISDPNGAVSTSRDENDITTGTAYRYHWVRVYDGRGDLNQNMLVSQLIFEEAPAAVDLRGEAQTAASAPSEARLVVLIENHGGGVYGTDIDLFASSDDGSTWDTPDAAGVIDEGEYLSGIDIVSAVIPLTGGGTDMRPRVTADAGTEIEIHAWYFDWG